MTSTRNNTTNPDRTVEALKEKLQEDQELALLIEASLVQADALARKDLDPKLYAALPWPVTLAEYYDYLTWFARWMPRQSDNDAWLEPGTDEHQEVYDRLCHFYWLIDQKVAADDNAIAENNPWFSKWLVAYADDWGRFLNTTESFNQETLDSFIELSPMYEVENSMIDGRPNAPSGWLTFNQFFARELNPGLRPIAEPFRNEVPVSPADCTFKAQYHIDENSEIPAITVKGTHTYASIPQLLENSQFQDAFAGGTFVHYFLGPYSYHRFHAPVAGKVRECYPVRGLVYLDVNLTDNQFDAPDSSEGGYEFYQARGIITIDTKDSPYGDIGLVTTVPIGMCQVSSVNMTATVGKKLLKGDEFGYFLFGGSDIIVLFQKGVDPREFSHSTDYRHYGSSLLAP